MPLACSKYYFRHCHSSTGSFWLALLVAMLLGLAVGFVNGMLVAYVGLPDFIGTFAVGSIVYGIKMLITEESDIFQQYGARIFTFIGQGLCRPHTLSVILMAVFVCIAIFVLEDQLRKKDIRNRRKHSSVALRGNKR